MKRNRKSQKRFREIQEYDDRDTSSIIDPDRRLTFADLGLSLPKVPPTQVVSIRLPSRLLNELRAFASARDIPYQALIKLLLAESLTRRKGRAA